MIQFLRNLVVHDFWLKIFSLALAVLIWVIVWMFAVSKDVPPATALSTITLPEKTFPNIPVFVTSAAADVRNLRVNPSEVAITVRGDAGKLQELERKLRDDPQAQDIRALVDLTDIESASGVKKRIAVTVPPNITFIRAIPEQVEIIVPPRP